MSIEDSKEDSCVVSLGGSYMDIMSLFKELSWVIGGGAGNDWPGSCPKSGDDVWDTDELEMFMGGSS